MWLELTKDQCMNVAEFIEMNLLRSIREDEYIDNLAWVESLILAKNACEKAVDKDENA